MSSHPARARTEHEILQSQVVQLLKMTGWSHLSIRRSIGKGNRWVTTTNIKGWPDLLCWSTRQPGRHVAIEIKAATDLSPDQVTCLDELRAADFEVYVIRTKDLDMLATILARRDQASYGQPTK